MALLPAADAARADLCRDLPLPAADHSGAGASARRSACCIYMVLVAAALIERLDPPLQTLSNVVSSLREGDYSFRARGAGTQDALGELAAEVNAAGRPAAEAARPLAGSHRPAGPHSRSHARAAVCLRPRKPAATGEQRRCSSCWAGRMPAASVTPRASWAWKTCWPRRPEHSLLRRESPTRWLLRKAAFRQDGVPHTLLLLADVSVPLQEEEQIAWKRLIRVLGHELSNSLAPIKSIAGSLLARVDYNAGRRRDAPRFSPRPGRGGEPRRLRCTALCSLTACWPSCLRRSSSRLRLGPLLERVVLLEQRLAVRA